MNKGTNPAQACTVRVLGPDGRTVGSGFLASGNGLVLTNCHVVEAARAHPGDSVTVAAATGTETATAEVQELHVADDVAVLRIPEGALGSVSALPLKRAAGTAGHEFVTLGFPEHFEVGGLNGYGTVGHLRSATPRLQLRQTSEMTRGFSGGPIVSNGAVVGMTVAIAVPDRYGRNVATAFAVATETVWALCSSLQPTEDCPFRGLDRFEIDDARYFFGRTAIVDELINALAAPLPRAGPPGRLVTLLGPSGSGKSSLVRAGVLARLRDGAIEGSQDWDVVVTRPAEMTGSLDALLGDSPALVMIDQFEELFTAPRAEIHRLGEEILGRLDATAHENRMIIVMRDDFYSQLADSLPELMRRVTPNLHNVPAVLTRDELESIVVGPAQAAGLVLDDGLLAAIAAAAKAASPTEQIRSSILPLVEHALTWLWQRREGGTLRLDVFRSIGGLTGALSEWAERTYQSLPPDDQALARRLLVRLAAVGDEQEGVPTRRVRRTFAEMAEGTPVARARAVLARFVDDRLVVTTLDEATDEQVVELIHDVLLREWRRLARWLEEDGAFLRWLDALTQYRVHSWNPDRDPGAQDWLNGQELQTALEWKARRDTDLPPRVRAFIDASRDAHESAIARERELEEDARRQRQLAESRAVLQRLRNESDQALAMLRIDPSAALAAAVELAGDSLALLPDAPVDTVQQALFATVREATERRIIETPHHDVIGVAFLGIGDRLLTVGSDGCLVEWRGLDGELHYNVVDDEVRETTALVVGADGSVALAGHGAIRRWKASLMEPIDDELPSLALSVAVAHEVEATIVGCSDGTVARRVAGTENRYRHGSFVAAVAVGADGSALIGGGDGRVLWWPMDADEPELLTRQSDVVMGVAVADDEAFIASADGTVSVFTPATGKLLSHFSASLSMVTSLAVSPDGSVLLVGSENGSIGLFDRFGSPVRSPLVVLDAVRSIACRADCTRIAAAAGRHVHVFDWLPRRPVPASDRTIRHRWDGHGDQVAPAIDAVRSDGSATVGDRKDVILGVAFLGDDEIVSAGTEQVARIWGLDGAEHQRFEPDAGGITSVAATRHGLGLIATGSRDNEVRLRLSSGAEICPSIRHDDHVMAVTFDAQQRFLASGGRDGVVKLTRSDGRRTDVRYFGHAGEVLSVALSPDGTLVASGGDDGTVHVWPIDDPSDGRVVCREDGRIWDVEFTPDGRTLLAGVDGGVISRIDLSGADEPRALRGHTNAVRAVCCHPAGQMFVSASADGTLQLWDLGFGRLGRPLIGHVGEVFALDVSADGRLAVSGGADGSVRIWRLGDWRDWLDDACSRLSKHEAGAQLAACGDR